MSSLRDTLILCDMDNTLLTAKGGIPECNRAVIELYTSLGGRFTVATGRPVESVRAALGGLKLSAPAICVGGSVLYDFSREKSLLTGRLDREAALRALNDVAAAFPDVGLEVQGVNGKVYLIRANRYTQAHMKDERLDCWLKPAEYVPEPWTKAVFAADSRTLGEVRSFLDKHDYGVGNYFLSTNTIYYEIMPAGVGKRQAMEHLCVLENITPAQVVMIGDYYNDLELMQAVGWSVAVANAPKEVQLAANQVTACSCAEGGVGEYLYGRIRSEQEELSNGNRTDK